MVGVFGVCPQLQGMVSSAGAESCSQAPGMADPRSRAQGSWLGLLRDSLLAARQEERDNHDTAKKKKKVIYQGTSVTKLLFLLSFRIMGFIKAIYPQVTWKMVGMNDEAGAWVSNQHRPPKMSYRASFAGNTVSQNFKMLPFQESPRLLL